MARYMEIAGQMHKQVEEFFEFFGAYPNSMISDEENLKILEDAAVALGHIINLAVRACPRAVQSTVRKNIVAEAMKGRCRVGMTKGTDPETGLTFNKIVIEAVKRS